MSFKHAISFSFRFLFGFLFAIAASAYGEVLPPYTNIVPGLDYVNIRDTNHPWSIHIARMDRSHTNLEVISTLSQGKIIGISSVRDQVNELPHDSAKPLVAVNGDFFVIAKGAYQGDPLGLQILHDELISAPTGASFWVEPGEKFCVGTINSKFTVTGPHGEKSSFGLNEECKSNNVVLFTPIFGDTTRTTNALEFVLEQAGDKEWLPLHADKIYSARVREIHQPGNSTVLTSNIAVLSVSPKPASKFAKLQAGDVIQLSTATSIDISHAQAAIGGRPLILTHGHEAFPSGTNALVRHPRTIIGWSKDYFYFVVVDGRQKNLSMGMNHRELAAFMKRLDCTDAINLDGGGSTTFWLNGKIMNSPSDKHERSVANALVIIDHNSGSKLADSPVRPAN